MHAQKFERSQAERETVSRANRRVHTVFTVSNKTGLSFSPDRMSDNLYEILLIIKKMLVSVAPVALLLERRVAKIVQYSSSAPGAVSNPVRGGLSALLSVHQTTRKLANHLTSIAESVNRKAKLSFEDIALCMLRIYCHPPRIIVFHSQVVAIMCRSISQWGLILICADDIKDIASSFMIYSAAMGLFHSVSWTGQ
jgi:hypothetical protein